MGKRKRINNKGRSEGATRFVKLDLWFLSENAWKSLKPGPRSLYIEIARRYNGSNNGEISLSVREAAEALNVMPNTAAGYFDELVNHGFIRLQTGSYFSQKNKLAREWKLTEFPLATGSPATKEFKDWKPKT